jgi:hypothetical protein
MNFMRLSCSAALLNKKYKCDGEESDNAMRTIEFHFLRSSRSGLNCLSAVWILARSGENVSKLDGNASYKRKVFGSRTQGGGDEAFRSKGAEAKQLPSPPQPSN